MSALLHVSDDVSEAGGVRIGGLVFNFPLVLSPRLF